MDTSNDDSSTAAAYDMLDILAFHSQRMAELLGDKTITVADQNMQLSEFIRKTDEQHESICNFKDDLDWFNVTEPLSFTDSLRGKIVVLDFFTYCCINCMHILPELKRLEDRYTVDGSGVVVIGVHSAKFDNEKDSSNILSAVQRYEITHPVVNDADSSMWIELKIKCWPTLLVLGPRANPLFILMGEGNYEELERFVGAAVAYYTEMGTLKMHTLPLNPATDLLGTSKLRFPGKIACLSDASSDSAGGVDQELYAISDSGNHRVLIVTGAGHVLHRIGGKSPGMVDGAFSVARFNGPQGLAFLSANILFVADTENHTIRRVDLAQGCVTTIAGTGRQGTDRVGGGIGCAQELSSPWDVAVYRTRDMDMSFHMDDEKIPEKDILLVAIAGLHQIWAIFLDEVIWWKFKKYAAGTVVALAGNGKEENRNNSYPQNAAFAQPSGISINRSAKELYLADSESSCVRKLSLTDGKVLPVAGGDRNPLNLFAYGDVDGKQFVAKLQHPLAVAYNGSDQSVYVADTYNHKVKRIDVVTNECVSCQFTTDDTSHTELAEPGGLCLSPNGDRLFIADTNNHRIEMVDLATNRSTTMQLSFHSADNGTRTSTNNNNVSNTNLQSTRIRVHRLGAAAARLLVLIGCNAGVKLTEAAPQKWTLSMSNDKWVVQPTTGTVVADQPIQLDILPSAASLKEDNDDNRLTTEYGNIVMTFKLNLCSGEKCFPKIFSITFPICYDGGDNALETETVTTVRATIINGTDVELN